ncbi:MAG: flavin reductase family protein [Sedimentisphaeraceae bacterium JB056]
MIKEVKDNSAIKFLTTKPTMIITTLHANGKVNAGVFGAYTNLSSEHVGVAVSPRSDTYRNILRTGEFTINVPSVEYVKTLSILARRFPEGVSEVEEASLTTRPAITNSAPSIKECVAAVECKLSQNLTTGSHELFIGVVTGGWIKEDVLSDDGRLDVFKAKVVKDFCYPKPLYMLPGEVVED